PPPAGAGAAATITVSVEFAAADPPSFAPVIETLSVEPTSSDVSRYVNVETGTAVHPLPLESQRNQSTRKVVGEWSQNPGEAVSVWPAITVPEIVGGVEFSGGTTKTAPVANELASVDPPAFVAVTKNRTVIPTSGWLSV